MRRLIFGLCALAAVLLTAPVLSGCSLLPVGSQVEKAAITVVDTAKEDRKAYNDQKADVLLTLPCDISIGAYYRMTNSVQQEAVTMLCSGKRPGEADPALALTGSTAAELSGFLDPPQ